MVRFLEVAVLWESHRAFLCLSAAVAIVGVGVSVGGIVVVDAFLVESRAFVIVGVAVSVVV